uniref:Putative secreted protein n=1 Tax=Ixodes ricinus TaxID=34613 RepID=A0A6B0UMR7_IXORI
MLMMKWPLQAMPTFTSSAWCTALKVSSGSTLPGEPSSRRPTRYTWTALPSADANTMARLSGLHRTRVAWSYSTFTRTDLCSFCARFLRHHRSMTRSSAEVARNLPLTLKSRSRMLPL